MVYLITCDKCNVSKVGHGFDPKKRLLGVQTGHHHKLRIESVIDGGSGVEKSIHFKYSADRLHGEWFRRTPSLVLDFAARDLRDRGLKEIAKDVFLMSDCMRGSWYSDEEKIGLMNQMCNVLDEVERLVELESKDGIEFLGVA